MQIVIDIPDEEFGIDIDGKFQDFFRKLRAETEAHMISDTNLVCGAYELETIDMFLEAFEKSLILPKGHGRLIDADALNMYNISPVDDEEFSVYGLTAEDIDIAQTVIEADRSEEE